MISNQLSNNLMFSLNNCTNTDKLGILNQNPLIITKSEAFNFNYADPDKLRYAQILAKRDIQSLKSTEDAKELPISVIKTERQCKKVKIFDATSKKKPDERVSSVKRVPGPQTPSRVNSVSRDRPSILRTTGMPVRSMSPPVKDTDTNWRPNEGKQVVDRLQLQMEQCNSKLDRLERSLRAQSTRGAPQAIVVPNKSHKDFHILEDKLRSLVENVPPRGSLPGPADVIPTPVRKTLPIDNVLTRLDTLAAEMDSIRARWTILPYETVSVCSEDDDDIEKNQRSSTMRYTRKAPAHPWHDTQNVTEDSRICLSVSGQLVSRLDEDRQRFIDGMRFPIFERCEVIPTRAGEWFSDDIVNEVFDGVMREFEEISGQLVEAILNEELTE